MLTLLTTLCYLYAYLLVNLNNVLPSSVPTVNKVVDGTRSGLYCQTPRYLSECIFGGNPRRDLLFQALLVNATSSGGRAKRCAALDCRIYNFKALPHLMELSTL